MTVPRAIHFFAEIFMKTNFSFMETIFPFTPHVSRRFSGNHITQAHSTFSQINQWAGADGAEMGMIVAIRLFGTIRGLRLRNLSHLNI